MKNLLAISAMAALLLLSGCSQKDPAIDATDETGTSTESPVDVKDPSATDGMEDSGIETSGTEVGMDKAEETLSVIEAQMKTVTFDFDKFNIRSDMEDNMKLNSTIAKAGASIYNLKLEGNCDEWGSDEYNYALGLKRAKAAKDAMIADGVKAERITMVSFGESNPTCTEQTQGCWSKNRRVDFKLLP